MTVLEDVFIKAAFQKGYAVSDRSDVQQVLQELRFQQSGLTASDAAKLGRMLNVPAILIVSLTGSGVNAQSAGYMVNYVPQYHYTAWCNMSVRLVSVEKSEVLGLASYSMQTETGNQWDAGPAISIAVTKLAEALPSRD